MSYNDVKAKPFEMLIKWYKNTLNTDNRRVCKLVDAILIHIYVE
jgi:hypothetical protein